MDAVAQDALIALSDQKPDIIRGCNNPLF